MAEVTWELLCQRPRRISRQNFPKRTRILSIPSKPYSFHSVHSAFGSRMNRMIFRLFRKRNSFQKNTNTVYSEYSYSGIVPKERALIMTTYNVKFHLFSPLDKTTKCDHFNDRLIKDTKGASFWDYSGIGTLGIDGICVLLRATCIPFSE